MSTADNAPYHDFGSILHESNTRAWVSDAVEVLGLSIQAVTDNVATNNFVFLHYHNTFYRRSWLGLENSG